MEVAVSDIRDVRTYSAVWTICKKTSFNVETLRLSSVTAERRVPMWRIPDTEGSWECREHADADSRQVVVLRVTWKL